jgi:hypothetical protein
MSAIRILHPRPGLESTQPAPSRSASTADPTSPRAQQKRRDRWSFGGLRLPRPRTAAASSQQRSRPQLPSSSVSEQRLNQLRLPEETPAALQRNNERRRSISMPSLSIFTIHSSSSSSRPRSRSPLTLLPAWRPITPFRIEEEQRVVDEIERDLPSPEQQLESPDFAFTPTSAASSPGGEPSSSRCSPGRSKVPEQLSAAAAAVSPPSSSPESDGENGGREEPSSTPSQSRTPPRTPPNRHSSRAPFPQTADGADGASPGGRAELRAEEPSSSSTRGPKLVSIEQFSEFVQAGNDTFYLIPLSCR